MKAVFGKTVYTGRKVVTNSRVLFDGRTVAGVRSKGNAETVGEYEVITPAFVDPHCHIGMRRAGQPASEGESNEQMESIVPLVDALDSVMMDDPAFESSIEAGVLYSCVVPGSGNIIGGRAAVIRNYGRDTTEALIARAGVKAAFGHNVALLTRDWKGARPFTRMGAVAMLRKRFDEVRLKMDTLRRARGKARSDAALSREDIVLRDILQGRERLRVHVHKADDIASLLRLVDELKLKVTVEHAGDVNSPETFKQLKKRGIPVVFGPVDSFAYKTELQHEKWRNIRHLLDSGVEFGLMTDHPVMLQNCLLLQLRHFLRMGLNRQKGIELITRRNADILGIGNRLGTLERRKWASFIGWNGDPLDLGSYPVAVFGEGRLLYSA